MYDNRAMILMLNTLTSTHPGSGTELSYVDMPIQREGHTGFPNIEASTLKGCIRHAARQKAKDKEEVEVINQIFGKPDDGDFASAVSITDARLLFFPVKSAVGIFGWITCPAVLERFLQDYRLAFGKDFLKDWNVTENRVASDKCKLKRKVNGNDTIMLEDYTYKVEKDNKFYEFMEAIIDEIPDNVITRDRILERAVVLGDDEFTSFVKYSTEVNTRIKIDEKTGTVSGNALFTEEFLPPECVLYSLVFFADAHQPQGEITMAKRIDKEQVRGEFEKLVQGTTIQVGADSTLGKGFVQTRLWGDK